MSRNRLIFTLSFLGIVISAVVAIHFLPKHYTVGESMLEPTVFWNNMKLSFSSIPIGSGRP